MLPVTREKKVPGTNIFWQYKCYSLLWSLDIHILRPLKMLTCSMLAMKGCAADY